MNELGYHYCRSRKKGFMTENDLRLRMKFCRNIKSNNLGINFWRDGISFYFDGTGFIYKKNPMDQATAPNAREWRK